MVAPEKQDELAAAKPGIKYGSGDIRVASGIAEGLSASSGDTTCPRIVI